MKEIKLNIENLTCTNCGAKIESAINQLSGVQSATLSVINKSLKMTIDENQEQQLRQEIQSIADRIEPGTKFVESLSTTKKNYWPIVQLVIAVILFLFNRPIFYLLSYLVAGYDIVIKSLIMLKNREWLGIHFLMSLATITAIFLQEYAEAAMVMIFYQLGENLQKCALNHSRKQLYNLLNQSKTLVRLANQELIEPEMVQAGESIILLPGDKLMLDGVVTSGNGSMNSSAINGESMPVAVSEGSTVLSGMVNLSGMLTIQVTKPYNQSTLTQMVNHIEHSIETKSKTELFINRFAKIYTPIVVLVAVIIGVLFPIVFNDKIWLQRALIFLVASCPCAIVLSVPLSYFAGIGKLSKSGILIKNSQVFQQIVQIKNIFFDKTQTLTTGQFIVDQIEGDPQGLYLAACLEVNSTHPLAAAVVSGFEKNALTPVLHFTEVAGKGVSGYVGNHLVLAGNETWLNQHGVQISKQQKVLTTLHVAYDNQWLSSITFKDSLKADVEKVLNQIPLHKAILSGDRQGVVDDLANHLNIEGYGDLTPQAKAEFIKNAEYSIFVGDGFNDGVAMANSDISVAMGQMGSDVAVEMADVVISDDRLDKLLTFFKVGKKTHQIALANIVFAVMVKLIVLVLGFFGYSNMLWAVFADVGVTLLTILNCLRIII